MASAMGQTQNSSNTASTMIPQPPVLHNSGSVVSNGPENELSSIKEVANKEEDDKKKELKIVFGILIL